MGERPKPSPESLRLGDLTEAEVKANMENIRFLIENGFFAGRLMELAVESGMEIVEEGGEPVIIFDGRGIA